MALKKFIILFILFFSSTLKAQEKIKFRFGIIPNGYDLARYDDQYKQITTPYYTFEKRPLFGTIPFFRLQDFFLGSVVPFYFSLEKKLKNKNTLQLGVILNDYVGCSYRLYGLQELYSYPATAHTEVAFSGLRGGGGSINARRYFIALERPLSSILNISAERDAVKKSRTHLTTGLRFAVNIIEKVPTSFGHISVDNPIAYTGDTLIIETQTLTGDGFWRAGLTLQAGLSFKLQKKNNKEILSLNINYEQGFFTLMGKEVDVYVKNYKFYNAIYSRGSRLNFMISRAFNLPDFKKKKQIDKLEKRPNEF